MPVNAPDLQLQLLPTTTVPRAPSSKRFDVRPSGVTLGLSLGPGLDLFSNIGQLLAGLIEPSEPELLTSPVDYPDDEMFGDDTPMVPMTLQAAKDELEADSRERDALQLQMTRTTYTPQGYERVRERLAQLDARIDQLSRHISRLTSPFIPSGVEGPERVDGPL